jgi:NADH-quinone oxidoreductase subunit G
MADLRKIIIDDLEVEVDPAMTLLQACEVASIEVPRFCYHERLSIAGNCRMCLVEVVGGPPNPTASCAMQVRDLRSGPNGEAPIVKTKSPMVKKAREGVMEFLLINHPLDCPICDQGGECDLQDQAMAYGVDFSRFREAKRATEDLDLGPLVETHMTRCISCTRCVRFTSEVAGITQMGQTGRGEDAEITSYLGETLQSNLQGNIIDLCPVGALTSKPYSFTARSWELKKTETIDVMDAMGASIRVDTKGREVMRILPLNHDGVNEEWISDKTRFVWDGLKRQRLDKPYIRDNGKLRLSSWREALKLAGARMKDSKVTALAGDLVSVEPMFALKQLIENLNGKCECRTDGSKLPNGSRGGYAGTACIEDVDHADHVLIIGSNPRVEGPVFNARIRKAWTQGADIELVGPEVDLTYEYDYIGSDRTALKKLLKRSSNSEIRIKNSLIIVGMGALIDEDGYGVLSLIQEIAEVTDSKILMLHTAASRVGAMDIGFVCDDDLRETVRESEVIFSLGMDEFDIDPGPFVIYQGSHGDRGAHRADIIFPSAAYTEESGLFVNMEGRAQLAQRANFAPGDAKENWAILRALSNELDEKLPYNNIVELRRLLFEEFPHLKDIGTIAEKELQILEKSNLKAIEFTNVIDDFYLTNPIARSSEVMAELSSIARSNDMKVAAE